MLLALGPGGYFVFMVDEVVPNDQRTADHINEVRPENEGRWRVEDIRQDDKRNDAGAHHGETYCQRSDHGGSLAQGNVNQEDQAGQNDSSYFSKTTPARA